MKDIDFSQPQRQSVRGIAIMFADTLQQIVRGLWAPLLIIFYKLDTTKIVLVAIFFVILLVLIAVIAYLKYTHFTFYLDQKLQEFVIQKGVISKDKITIQLNKIQQVAINQSVIQRFVGVYSLDIDTAGSLEKEVSIRAIDLQSANYLKELLLESDKAIPDETKANETESPFLMISLSTLLKVGLTSNYGRSLVLLIGFLGTMYNGIYDIQNTFEIDQNQVEGYIEQRMAYFSAAIGLALLFLLVIGLNVGRVVVKYFDFCIKKQYQSLVVTHGLFAKKSTLLKSIKVQTTLFSQNYFQKKLGLFTLALSQASSGDNFENENAKKTAIEVPGCNQMERDTIMKMIYGDQAHLKEEVAPNFRYLIKAVFLSLVLPMIAFVVFVLNLWHEGRTYFPFLFVYLIVVLAVIWFQFKNYRMYLNPNCIEFKRNAWDVQHQFVAVYKIQGITTKRYFWHKRADLVHITFHTAAGDINFKFAKYSNLKKWINYWLAEVEQSSKKWM